MRQLTIILCLLLIFGHVFTELGEIIQKVNGYRPIYINPFLSPNYQWHDPKGIDFYWWIKYCCDDFLWCVTFFVLAKVAYQYSFRLFLIGLMFFFYHVIDSFMLWWNYKTSHWLYWALNVTIILCIISLFIPEKKQATIKYLK